MDNLKNTISKRANLFKILLFVAAAAVIAYFFPNDNNREYVYKVGKPWSYSLLTAPFDMPIFLDSATVKAKKDSIDKAFVPIFKIDRTVEDRTLSKITSYYKVAFYTGDLRKLESLMRHTYGRGIVDNDVYEAIKMKQLPNVRIINGNTLQTVPTDGMVSVKEAYSHIDSAMNSSPVIQNVNLAQIIVPNIVKDTATSQKYLDDLYRNTMAPVGVIQQGERIVDRGEIITPQTAMLLSTYESMMKSRSKLAAHDAQYPIVGYIVIVATLLFLLYMFFRMFRTRIFNDNRKLLFVVLLVTVFSIASFYLLLHFRSASYFLPLAIVPIMLVTFFDSRTAFFVSIIQILICSFAAGMHIEFVVMHIVAAMIAIDTLQDLSKRSQLIRTAILIFFGYALTYTAMYVISEGNVNTISYKPYVYMAINSVFLSFAYILIFVCEKLFGFVSKVTLVELSDVNNKLLRELSEKCPGTFQHSMQVSNLVPEAAHEIGANTQLARAGALYHDIGKMENPAFFTENQHDVNPHELISPEQSAKIVIRHVTDGLKLADKAKLPAVIKDFIAEHHGKSTTKYFYTTACNNNGGNPVDPAPYTYPGPNPRSKETAILMMADATEAASRSLKEHTDESITALVNKIIDGQIAQGLMKDAPLSFRDVETIKKVFIARLRTMYHTRVSYPELIKKDGAQPAPKPE